MGSGRIWIRGGRVLDPATGRDEVADVLRRGRQDRGRRRGSRRARAARWSTPPAPGWCPASSTCTCTCASRARSTRKTSPRAAAPRWRAASRAVVCMANTQPVNDDPSVTEYILDRARQESPARVYPIGAATRGLAGEVMTEMVALVDAGCVALSRRRPDDHGLRRDAPRARVLATGARRRSSPTPRTARWCARAW